MPIAFKCSSCDKAFRVGDEMAGRKAKCPGCATMLTVPAPVRAAAAKPAAPKPAARSRPAPRPEPEDDDYEVVDEDDEDQEAVAPTPRGRQVAKVSPPRRKPTEDEDDDRPRRRRPVEEDDEDEEPAIVVDDGDDEEPDDEDDAPKKEKKKRGKKGKKKDKKSPVGMILLIGGLCVVGLLLLGGGALIFFFASGGDSMQQALTFAPESSQFVISVRLADIEKSGAYTTINSSSPNTFNFNQDPELRTLTTKGIVHMVVMTSPPPPTGSGESIEYYKLKQAITADEIKGSRLGVTYSESKVGSYTVIDPNVGDSFCLVNSTTVLAGKGNALRAVLQRNKKPTLSKDLEKAMAEADWSKHMSFALNANAVKNQGPGIPGLGKEIDAVEAVGGYVTFSTDITAHVAAICKDDKTAADAKKTIDDSLAALKNLPGVDQELRSTLDGLKFTTSGGKLILDVTVKGDTIASMAKKQQQQPFPGRPPGF